MSWFNYFLMLFGLSWAFVGFYRSYALRKGIVDKPNVRSSHSVITARGGGFVFGLLWFALIGICFYMRWIPQNTALIFLPALIILALGFRDDMKGLSKKTRLIGQTAAALLSLYVMEINSITLLNNIEVPVWLSWPILTLFIVWMTNLMNFMDGSDGLASVEAIFVLGVGAYAFIHIGAYSYAVLSFGLVSLVAGFLTWNWPKASIFMGDSGSAFLGFVIALFAIASNKWYNVPFEFWLILSAAFWFDATVTLIRRILAKEKWTEPHCKHAYQRLLQAGWSHAFVLVGTIIINSVLALMALWAYDHPELQSLILLASVCFLTIIYVVIEMNRPMYRTWYA